MPKTNIKRKNTPLISVIINCYNGEKYLNDAIKSVLSQTYQNWEIVFWDNQSKDKSAEIFKSYLDSRLHYYLSTEFNTLGLARNLAVKKASGEWIAFLDCDDIWLPNKLMLQVEIITNCGSDIGVVYGQSLVLNNNNIRSSKWAKRQNKYNNKTKLKLLPEGDVFSKLLKFNFIPLLTAVFAKQSFQAVGGISNNLNYAEDYDLFLKLTSIKKVRAVQQIIALYRVHESNMSINNQNEEFYEVIEILSKYDKETELIAGLRYHHTSFALAKIKDGNFREGLSHLRTFGSIKDIFAKILLNFQRCI